MITVQTEWVMPNEYPDLRGADEIAIDLETRDPDLKSKGSGAITGNGEVIGIAVAVDGYKNYFPIAHGEGPNMDRDKVLSVNENLFSSINDAAIMVSTIKPLIFIPKFLIQDTSYIAL